MDTRKPATYYQMDKEVGGIPPGRQADLGLLPDLERFRPVRVIANGVDVLHEGRLSIDLPTLDWDALGMRPRCAPATHACLQPDWQPPAHLPGSEFVGNR